VLRSVIWNLGVLTSVRIYFDPVFAFIVKRFRVFVRRFTIYGKNEMSDLNANQRKQLMAFMEAWRNEQS
ncbi:hypothetical protein WI845_16220, partial [Vibrio cholerae]